MTWRLSARAADDLLHIAEAGIRLFGLDQAARYHERLERTLDLLAENPRMGRERRELRPPARVHPCGAHVILYAVEPGGGILVLRVRHGREDWAGSGG